jgi:ABC-type multidrug transport system ATPase subunit
MLKVQVNNLSKTFGQKKIFTNVTFNISDGITGIAGPNGSGKTTLLKCLSLLLRPTSGSVIWYRDEQKLSPTDLKKSMGYAAPYLNHYSELTCFENLNFICQLRHIKNADAIIQSLLDRIGLHSKMDEQFGNLSSGQQQRIKLAAAILYKPDILFLDEPGTNLDRKGHDFIKTIVQEWNTEKRLLILATNDPQELNLCDEIIHIDQFSAQ